MCLSVWVSVNKPVTICGQTDERWGSIVQSLVYTINFHLLNLSGDHLLRCTLLYFPLFLFHTLALHFCVICWEKNGHKFAGHIYLNDTLFSYTSNSNNLYHGYSAPIESQFYGLCFFFFQPYIVLQIFQISFSLLIKTYISKRSIFMNSTVIINRIDCIHCALCKRSMKTKK